VAAAARAAREAVWGARRGEDFRREAARIVDRHASRKDPRFVNDRERRARGDARQMSLDL
jgi:deoxyribodipyrimidine photo-lyase